eukprot:COSAG06_NODE_8446_length_2171_cov_43.077220_3_plen_47_part_00
MAAMEQAKRSLLRYLGNDRDALNEVVGFWTLGGSVWSEKTDGGLAF